MAGLFVGSILLFSVKNGEPLAMINDGVLQHMRVGACAGLRRNSHSSQIDYMTHSIFSYVAALLVTSKELSWTGVFLQPVEDEGSLDGSVHF